MDRRSFVTALGLAPFAASPLLANSGATGPKGKAEHCIFIWLGGGMGQADTFDPKAVGDNKATKKKPGSLYPSIETSVPGVRLCEHLPRTAKLMEHVTAVRSVNHKVIDEHAFATNLVHTGRMISGNAVYPSIGSIVAHRRGAADPSVPAYMLIGYPNVSRGPGFLGIKDGYIYLVDTETGPNGFTTPGEVSPDRKNARLALLEALGERAPGGSAVEEYAAAQQEAFRLAAPRSCATSTSSRSRPSCAPPTAASSVSAACSPVASSREACASSKSRTTSTSSTAPAGTCITKASTTSTSSSANSTTPSPA